MSIRCHSTSDAVCLLWSAFFELVLLKSELKGKYTFFYFYYFDKDVLRCGHSLSKPLVCLSVGCSTSLPETLFWNLLLWMFCNNRPTSVRDYRIPTGKDEFPFPWHINTWTCKKKACRAPGFVVLRHQNKALKKEACTLHSWSKNLFKWRFWRRF